MPLIELELERDGLLEMDLLGNFIGSAYAPQVDVTDTDTGHEVAITYDDAATGITTKTFDVEDGHDGADGYSPTATVTQLADGATIRITDKDGTTTATVHDGTDGTDGQDGYSPTARVTQTATGATISITDKGGTTTATVSNGTDGADGSDGADGFSPTVDVQEIEGGHEVTITDAQGPHSFDVMDGDPAEPGSITDEMLAPDGIKAQVAQLWGNQLKGTLTGDILTAADAYAAPPMALTVDGRSTQAGTPTPDAPVPIVSVDALTLHATGKNVCPRDAIDHYTIGPNGEHVVDNPYQRVASAPIGCEPSAAYVFSSLRIAFLSIGFYDMSGTFISRASTNTSASTPSTTLAFQTPSNAVRMVVSAQPKNSENTPIANAFYNYDCQLELGSTATAYEPYAGTTVPLYDGTLRSLSDGTKDTLSLAYLRPSTRDGWAWYSRELVQRVGEVDLGSLAWANSTSGGYQKFLAPLEGIINTGWSKVLGYCTCYAVLSAGGLAGQVADNSICRRANAANVMAKDPRFDGTDVAAFKAAVAGQTVTYLLLNPITTQLDPIELPVLPAPNCTVWADPTTGLQMEYVRDTNIVIAAFEVALADLATS